MAECFQTINLPKSQAAGTTVERIDPFADQQWDDLVGIHPDQTIFHQSAWARVLAETYGQQPFYLKILVHGIEAALVPLMEVKSRFTGCRGVSLPFSDFAGILWNDSRQADPVYAALLELTAARKWKHLEMRGGFTPPTGAKSFQTYDGHQLDLRKGTEALFENFDVSVRRAIRKSESSQLEVKVERDDCAMDEFYQLHGRTRRRHGLPPQPQRFFRAIAYHLIAKNLGTIVLARLEGTPVAGAIFFHSGGHAVYKFGASDAKYWPLRPNQGVMWTAIRELVKIGCNVLHFGRTSPSDEGLTRFKLSWGSETQVLSYFRYHGKASAWLVAPHLPSESHPLIFGHLPMACNHFAGRIIYPHLD